jgi:hypothetical protein
MCNFRLPKLPLQHLRGVSCSTEASCKFERRRRWYYHTTWRRTSEDSALLKKGFAPWLYIVQNADPLKHEFHLCNKTNSLALVRNRTIPSDRRLSAKLVPTFADRGCRVVSATDPHGRILGFLDRSGYFFIQVAPQLSLRGWVNPVPDPLLLRKSVSAGNRTRTSGSVARNSDH